MTFQKIDYTRSSSIESQPKKVVVVVLVVYYIDVVVVDKKNLALNIGQNRATNIKLLGGLFLTV